MAAFVRSWSWSGRGEDGVDVRLVSGDSFPICRMMDIVDVLYVSPQLSTTRSALADSARARGIQVVECHGSEDLVAGQAHAYGGPKFIARLSETVDLAPLEPTDEWLPELPWRFRRREVRLMALSQAGTNSGRAFVKTPREKDFEAGAYSGWELPVVAGTDDPMVLVSEIVTFTREYRLLLLDGQVHTGCRYVTAGRLDVRPLADDADRREVLSFADAMLSEVAGTLPSAVTVDVGWAVHADRGDEGFAVVEANMAWFSNIYDCDPGRALDVVMRAAGPGSAVASRDRAFVRIGERRI